jgi:coenzyme Q-binding protein COQ10
MASRIETERRLPYPPELLAELVGDVRRYPEFIPWIQHLTITDEADGETDWSAVAHVQVGWRNFTERFSTAVRMNKSAGEVDVSLVRGPLRSLENAWRFVSDGAGGSLVRFSIAYDFRNPILNAVLAANRERAISRIMSAFEAEAARRYAALT